MRLVIRQVETLKNIDPARHIGEIFVLPDGSVFQAVASDELGGIGGFFKSLGKAALNIGGGLVGLSGIGNAIFKDSGNDNAALDSAIAQYRAEIEKVVKDFASGAIQTERQAHDKIAALYQSWDSWKMSQSKHETRDYLYRTGDLHVLKWTEATAAIAEAAKNRPTQQTNQLTGTPTTTTGLPFGLTAPQAGLGLLALIFLLRR